MPDDTLEGVEDDGADEGPIVLEPGDCCKKCAYSFLHQIPKQLQLIRLCRRMPPVPMMVPTPTPQGTAMTLTAQFPMVDDATVCFEFDEQDGESPGGLIATGLLPPK